MNDIITRYLDTWNAADADLRDQLLDSHWSPVCTYVDPMMDVTGHEQLSAGIDAVHRQFPGFVFSHVGTADIQRRHIRFQWGLGPAGEAPVIIGFDVLTVDENQMIASVYGFLDQVPGQSTPVPAYAIGVITDVQLNDELFEYMAAVETSVRDFGGRWVSHGRTPEVREGDLDGDLVIIEFPDLDTARAWYESNDYQAIIPLRTRNARSIVAITEGVPADYTTARTIGKLRGFAAAG